MKFVEIPCPVKNRPVSTGMRHSEAARWIGKKLMLQCPACRQVHNWTPTQAMVEAPPMRKLEGTLYLDS